MAILLFYLYLRDYHRPFMRLWNRYRRNLNNIKNKRNFKSKIKSKIVENNLSSIASTTSSNNSATDSTIPLNKTNKSNYFSTFLRLFNNFYGYFKQKIPCFNQNTLNGSRLLGKQQNWKIKINSKVFF